jgi:hypothetical protein
MKILIKLDNNFCCDKTKKIEAKETVCDGKFAV